MGSIVRPARPEEAAELARLHLRTALTAYAHIFPPEAPPPTLAEVEAQWAHWLGPDHADGRRGFVAVDPVSVDPVSVDPVSVDPVSVDPVSSAIVGTVLAGPDPDEPEVGHLARLYVAPERWAGGIGRQLYDVAMASMVGAGFPEATLWVLERNLRARAWYERLGWRATAARKPTYAPAGIVDVGYRLDLDRHRGPGI